MSKIISQRIRVFCMLVCITCSCVVANAQDTVRIGVTGLTCSSCSKSVEEQLMKVSFVYHVIMNLNANEATVIIDDTKSINWVILAKAVYNAGFSIGYFHVPSCEKTELQYKDINCSDKYKYVGSGDKLPNPDYYTLVGKYFMDNKSYAKWRKSLNEITESEMKSPIYYYY